MTPEGPSIDVIHTPYAVAAHPVLFMDLLRFIRIFATVRTFWGPKAPTPGIFRTILAQNRLSRPDVFGLISQAATRPPSQLSGVLATHA